MQKLTVLSIASLIFISGCVATPEKLTKRAPDLVFQSKQPPKVVAECIHAKWESVGETIASSRNVGDKIRVMAHIGKSRLGYMAEVEEKNGMTAVNYYMGVLTIGTDPWRDELKTCL